MQSKEILKKIKKCTLYSCILHNSLFLSFKNKEKTYYRFINKYFNLVDSVDSAISEMYKDADADDIYAESVDNDMSCFYDNENYKLSNKLLHILDILEDYDSSLLYNFIEEFESFYSILALLRFELNKNNKKNLRDIALMMCLLLDDLNLNKIISKQRIKELKDIIKETKNNPSESRQFVSIDFAKYIEKNTKKILFKSCVDYSLNKVLN